MIEPWLSLALSETLIVRRPSLSALCAVRTPTATKFNPPQPLSKGGGMLQAQQNNLNFVNNILFSFL